MIKSRICRPPRLFARVRNCCLFRHRSTPTYCTCLVGPARPGQYCAAARRRRRWPAIGPRWQPRHRVRGFGGSGCGSGRGQRPARECLLLCSVRERDGEREREREIGGPGGRERFSKGRTKSNEAAWCGSEPSKCLLGAAKHLLRVAQYL